MTKQHTVYFAIDDFIAQNGYSPSVRDIKRVTGFGLASIHKYLKTLRAWGMIAYEPKKPRTIRIIHD